MFATERVLRAVASGKPPAVRDVRDLARAVLTADPITVLAWRLLRQPVARMRGSEVAELAELVLRDEPGRRMERGTRKGA